MSWQNKLANVKRTLLSLAYNQIKSEETRNEAVDKLRLFIEGENNETDKGDWKKAKLMGQIKRYLSGIDRENEQKATRYFLFTLMKSGTKHVEQCLSKVYGLERFTPSFDFETVNQSATRIKPVYYNETDFIFGESYLSYHIHPSIELLNDINRFKMKTLILLRNPAQTVVSHYHYCLKNNFGSKDTYKPGEYFGPSKIRDQDELKSFLLTKTFPRACKFINAWLEVDRLYKKNDSNLINIFYHEDMVKNKDKFYKRLNDAINIRTETDTSNPLVFEDINNHNQRKGSTNEWKTFFSNIELDYIKKNLDEITIMKEDLHSLWEIEGK